MYVERYHKKFDLLLLNTESFSDEIVKIPIQHKLYDRQIDKIPKMAIKISFCMMDVLAHFNFSL